MYASIARVYVCVQKSHLHKASGPVMALVYQHMSVRSHVRLATDCNGSSAGCFLAPAMAAPLAASLRAPAMAAPLAASLRLVLPLPLSRYVFILTLQLVRWCSQRAQEAYDLFVEGASMSALAHRSANMHNKIHSRLHP